MATFGDPTGSSLDAIGSTENGHPTISTSLHSDMEFVSRQHSTSPFENLQGQVGTTEPEAKSTANENHVMSVISQSNSSPTERLTNQGLGSTSSVYYVNNAYDNQDELVLDPGHLCFQTDIDEVEDNYADDKVIIDRPIYSQDEFERGFGIGHSPSNTAVTWVVSKFKKCDCSWPCFKRTISHHLPFLAIMREYKVKKDFVADLIAGLTVGIMHIPQGMAYGQLANLEPVYGLYASFFPVIIYFFLGSSKHISMGTFAIISLMIGSAITRGLQNENLALKTWNQTVHLGGGNVTYTTVDNKQEIFDTKVMLAMSVTFIVGIIQTLLGVFRLGFLTVYLSDPLISGFTTGAAIHVLTSQIKHLFGISAGTYSGVLNLAYTYRDIFKNLPQTKPVTLIASIVCMFVLVIVKEYINGHPKIKPKLFIPIPIELLVVVFGTIISHFAQLEEKYSVKAVGNVPVGLPVPNLKAFSYISNVISDSVALAIVSFAITVSMAKIFAKKHNYTVDSNQELLAYGISNVICSFFSSYVASASLSRSLIQEDVGGKTQVTGLVSSILLLIVLLVVGPYFKSLPNVPPLTGKLIVIALCVLASIILVSLKGMFKQFLDLKFLWRISILDFFTWIVAFVATVLLDVDIGLLVGVIFALLTVIIKSQRPYCCLLGQVPGTDIYRDISVYNIAEEIPHIKIFRFDSAIFFANAEYFKHCLYKLTVNPYSLKKLQKKLSKKKKKKVNLFSQITNSISGTEIPERSESCQSTCGNEEVINNHNAVNLQADVPSHTQSLPIESLVPTLTDIYYLIIDCSTVSYVDSMGVKALQQVISELRNFKITVYLAQCKANVREMFSRTNFYKTESKNYIFISTHDAVVHAQLEQSEAARQSTTNITAARASGITVPVVNDINAQENLQNFNVNEINESIIIASNEHLGCTVTHI